MDKGTLVLLPNLLDENLPWEGFLPAKMPEEISRLQGLIVESEKEGRKFLRRFLPREVFEKIPLRVYSEHTTKEEILKLLEPMMKGETWGLISDAGLPCIADPGSLLVFHARKKKILVRAVSGPSSVFLSLLLSGLPAQRFSFEGYLPKEEDILKKALVSLEKNSNFEKKTFLWIETPYRFEKMVRIAKDVLRDTTLFGVALDLTSPQEAVLVQSIREWKNFSFPEKEKRLCVFLLYAAALD